MKNKKSISHLLVAIKNGDEKAFKVLHELHYNKLTAFINGYTKNNYEAEDILQEVFIKLWSSRKKLNGKISEVGYLYRMAYHTYIDKYRKDKRNQNVLDGWKYKRLVEAIDEDDEITMLRIEKLKLAIEELPPRCKEVFILCKYENLSYAQIGDHLDISPKTVHAQMCKAYMLIRRTFNENELLTLFLHFN